MDGNIYGAMFAPRPDLVAAEFLRVCRRGGIVAMANWTRQGFIGKMMPMPKRLRTTSSFPPERERAFRAAQ